MGQEIERKFLVNHKLWNAIEKPSGQYFRQGYLLIDSNKTIRIRLAKDSGFLTIKGATIGATRSEFEYEIPHNEAAELLDNFAVAELSKIRYIIPLDVNVWEVDVFLGNNEGLIIAEIELDSEDEKFNLPEWIAEEVTSEAKYYNSNLTQNPFKNW